MASLNKVTLIGYLGRDPEIHHATDGTAICNVSIATSHAWTDKASGERREKTEWHQVAFFKRAAEIAGEYLKKGAQVYVEGRLRTRTWQDKNSGENRYALEIVGTHLLMLGARKNEAAASVGRIDGGDSAEDLPF